jgi:hypothetical protein
MKLSLHSGNDELYFFIGLSTLFQLNLHVSRRCLVIHIQADTLRNAIDSFLGQNEGDDVIAKLCPKKLLIVFHL